MLLRPLSVFALVAMLAIAVPSRAETITPLDELYSLTNWGADDGMPNCDVRSVWRTQDGFLWLGTNEGLARFDGIQFVRRKILPGDEKRTIGDVFEETPGTLLVSGPDCGLLQVKGGQVSVHPAWPAISAISHEQPIKASLREADGIFWVILTDGTAYRWAHGKIERFPSVPGKQPGICCGVVQTSDGRTYVSRGAGLEIYENGALRTETAIPDTRLAICTSETGEMWIATPSALFRTGSGKFFKEVDLPPNSRDVTAIRESHGSVWIGLLGIGLIKLENKRLTSVAVTHRLIRCLYDDGDGNLWIGTGGGGLDRIRESRFSLFAAGVADSIGTICEDLFGDMWTGNSTGIWRIRGGRMEDVNFPPPGPSWANCICPDAAGIIWIGARGLWRVPVGEPGEPKQAIPVPNSPEFEVLALFQARDGSMWAGGIGGPLYRFRGDKCDIYGPAEGYDGRIGQLFCEDRAGHLWVATRSRELYEFNGERFVRHETGERALALYADKETNGIWMGTGHGLRYRRDGRTVQIGKEHGFLDETISQILEDRYGSLWFASNRALFQVPRKELMDYVEGRSNTIKPTVFGKSDGVSGFYAVGQRQPSSWESANGQLWFVGRAGIVTTNPARKEQKPLPTQLYIEDFLVDGKSLGTTHPSFGSSSQHLEVQFTAPCFVSPKSIQFQYRLSGGGSEWIGAGTQRFAVFSSLPPGRHVFEVSASQSGEPLSVRPASLDFEVLPMWWETASARVLGVISGCLLLIGGARVWAHRRYKAKLRAVEQERRLDHERARIARDLHDGLGAGLTQVSLLTAELRHEAGNSAAASECIAQLSSQALTLSRDLDAAVWAVSPRHDNLSSLCTYFCEFALEHFRHSPIRFRLDVEEEIPEIPLAPNVRHNLLMAAREAMNNALKHSGASEVHLYIAVPNGTLEIDISDNGHGFTPSEHDSNRSGLGNMQSRMSEIGGQIEIRSSDLGTSVRLHLSLSRFSPKGKSA